MGSLNREQFDEWTYKNKDVLTYLYVDKVWKQKEIAEEFDTTKSTISRWMSRFNIETRFGNIEKLGVDEIERLYWEEGKTQKEIAEIVGSIQGNISRFMRKHGIDRRNKSNTPASFRFNEFGYPMSYSSADNASIHVHRLVAVAEYGIDAVAGNDVHHKNEIRWDNRPENLEVLSRSDHVKEHREREYGDKPWRNESLLRKRYKEDGLTAEELSKEFGCSMSTIYTHLDKFGIETRPTVAGGYYNEN